jgi:hypothetical protein
MKSLLRRFSKAGGCCGTGSLVPLEGKPADSEKGKAESPNPCCDNPDTCC